MQLAREFSLPIEPVLKHDTTYMRGNRDLKKCEMMGYGAESGTMNASYFDVIDAARVPGSVFGKKLLHLRNVCWMSPNAKIEKISKSWSTIDVAIYHAYTPSTNLS